MFRFGEFVPYGAPERESLSVDMFGGDAGVDVINPEREWGDAAWKRDGSSPWCDIDPNIGSYYTTGVDVKKLSAFSARDEEVLLQRIEYAKPVLENILNTPSIKGTTNELLYMIFVRIGICEYEAPIWYLEYCGASVTSDKLKPLYMALTKDQRSDLFTLVPAKESSYTVYQDGYSIRSDASWEYSLPVREDWNTVKGGIKTKKRWIIDADSFNKMLDDVVMLNRMLENTVGEYGFRGVYSFEDNDVLCDSYYCTIKIKPRICVAGKVAELDRIDEKLRYLKISPLKQDQRIEISEEALALEESNVLMQDFMGVDNTTLDCGVLMNLAWLSLQRFWLSTWREQTSATDWRLLEGRLDDNVVDVLKKINCMAAITMPDSGDTVLVTSAGFLEITDGTVENPVEVNWLSLATLQEKYDLTAYKKEAKEYDEIKGDSIKETTKGLCNIIDNCANYMNKRDFACGVIVEKRAAIEYSGSSRTKEYHFIDKYTVSSFVCSRFAKLPTSRGRDFRTLLTETFEYTLWIARMIDDLMQKGSVQVCTGPIGRKGTEIVPIADVAGLPSYVKLTRLKTSCREK